MEQLNLENFEWLLMVVMKEMEECEAVIERLTAIYSKSLEDLHKSPSYQERMKQFNSSKIWTLIISEQILKLKNVTI